MSLAPFIRTNSGFHPSLDIDGLLKFYRDLRLDVGNISSPSDLAAWEVLRKRHSINDPDSIPCDLFVWGTGTPPDRRLTRVGGVPWLPKRIPWPVIDGVVLSFLCQFDFRDSLDLVGELPGDLLLVFVADENTCLRSDIGRMRFVWVTAAETDVIETAPKPTRPFKHVCAWGVRHRSADMPNRWTCAYEIPDERLWMLPVLWGTKIGGVPYNSQQNLRAVPAGYLCQLVSIQPSSRTQWPWVDREQSLDEGSRKGGIGADENCLMIGDMGELTLFLRSDGSIDIDSSCG